MVQKTNKEEKIPSKLLLTKFNLTARLLVGAYLLYTSYSLIDGVINGEGRDKYFLGAFMIAFAIIGVLMMWFAGRNLLQGRYVGGVMDAGDEAEYTEEAVPEETADKTENKIEGEEKPD